MFLVSLSLKSFQRKWSSKIQTGDENLDRHKTLSGLDIGFD